MGIGRDGYMRSNHKVKSKPLYPRKEKDEQRVTRETLPGATRCPHRVNIKCTKCSFPVQSWDCTKCIHIYIHIYTHTHIHLLNLLKSIYIMYIYILLNLS